MIFFGEETSWLQHQIGFATPEAIVRRNAQREFNLHNFMELQGGAWFAGQPFSWKTLLKSEHLFQFGFVAYFLALPVAALFPLTGRWIARLQVPYPARNLMLCIWIPLAVSAILTILAPSDVRRAIAEDREMIFALSILIFVSCYARLLSPSTSAAR